MTIEELVQQRIKAGLSANAPIPLPEQGSVINRAGVTISPVGSALPVDTQTGLVDYNSYSRANTNFSPYTIPADYAPGGKYAEAFRLQNERIPESTPQSSISIPSRTNNSRSKSLNPKAPDQVISQQTDVPSLNYVVPVTKGNKTTYFSGKKQATGIPLALDATGNFLLQPLRQENFATQSLYDPRLNTNSQEGRAQAAMQLSALGVPHENIQEAFGGYSKSQHELGQAELARAEAKIKPALGQNYAAQSEQYRASAGKASAEAEQERQKAALGNIPFEAILALPKKDRLKAYNQTFGKHAESNASNDRLVHDLIIAGAKGEVDLTPEMRAFARAKGIDIAEPTKKK